MDEPERSAVTAEQWVSMRRREKAGSGKKRHGVDSRQS